MSSNGAKTKGDGWEKEARGERKGNTDSSSRFLGSPVCFLAAESSLSRSEFEVRGSRFECRVLVFGFEVRSSKFEVRVLGKVRFERDDGGDVDDDGDVDAVAVARFSITPDFEPI
jgi:hypothetical protein